MRGDRLAHAFASGDLVPPPQGTILVLNARPSALYAAVGTERFRCEQPLRPLHDLLAREGLAVAPGSEADDGASAMAPAMAIVSLPRQRAEGLGLIAEALTRLPAGATLVVDGARTDGIDTLQRSLAAVLPIAGVLPKAHGRLVWLVRPERLPEAVADWTAAAAAAPNPDGFVTQPGTFSADGVDPGSARLAAHLDARLSGRVADLGAGWGWLAARALAGSPAIAALDLYEADARALAAARLNIADPRAAFHWSDVAALGPPQDAYDWVITNPPFHPARAADPALGAAFIAAAQRMLKPDGGLLLVSNRQLPYEAPLARAFRTVTPLAEDARYKVLAAERPRRAG